MRADIVPAQEEHVRQILEDVREADRLELWAAGLQTPEEAMRGGMNAGPSWAGTIDGAAVCMFGVVPGNPLSGVGIPWMVGTNALERHAVTFLRRCRPQMRKFREDFPLLLNYVDARNTVAIKWLSWLGFEIHPPQPMGPLSVPFHYFEMR